MIVVPLIGGPKLVRVRNTDGQRASFVDFTPDGEKLATHREVLAPGERRAFKITGKKYSHITAPKEVTVVSVEEA
jgi:hypothetical protein